MLRGLIIVSSFIIALVVFSSASAAEPTARIHGILINADSMFRDNERETAELEGHVQIVFQGQHIRADRARVSLRARQVHLFGNVEIMDAKNTIVGNQVYLDYDNNTGIIYDGYVQSGSVLFAGSVLQKIGDSEFVVTTADYTTCTNCPATWSFTGSTVRAELGGYAYIKNAILRLGSVPVFWFPYLVVPLKSDRQSGVLTPSFEVSDASGFSIGIPYFWAISESSDATIELKDYQRRGLKGLLEYRYVLNGTSYGTFNGATLKDRAISSDPRFNKYRSLQEQNKPLDRWFIKYDHYQEMPDGGVHRAQLNLASDLQYPKDFPLETLNHGDAAMENRVSYTKNTETQHYSVDSSYYVNLLHADPLAYNDDAVHRLPELRFSQAQKSFRDTNFIYALDVDLVNFARSGNSYDDMVSGVDEAGAPIRYPKNTCNSPRWENDPTCARAWDGSYDPTIDQIRTGQRLDLRPTLYYPLPLGSIDVIPKLVYRETHYSFNIPDQPYLARRYLRTEMTARSKISRVFGDALSSKSTRYKHEIIPEITYTHLPWLSQDQHPFFGTGDLANAPYSSRDSVTDLDISSDYGLQFDYNDRVYDRNLVTFALINKLTEKRWVMDRPEYRQIAYLKIAQSYNESGASGGGASQPWSDLTADLKVVLNNFETYILASYYPYQNVTNSSSRARILNNKGQFLQVQISSQYPITPGQEVDVSKRQEDYTFSAGFISRYLNAMGKVTYDANPKDASTNEYQVKSWAMIMQLKPPGDCWLINLATDKVTGGDTRYFVSLDFNFDGTPKPPLPSSTLDLYGF